MLYAKIEEMYSHGPAYTVDEGYVNNTKNLESFLDNSNVGFEEEEVLFEPSIIEEWTRDEEGESKLVRLELITVKTRMYRLKRLYESIGEELDEAIIKRGEEE